MTVTCPDCKSDMIGVEYGYPSPEQYDGISEWRCIQPHCGTRIGRWTGQRIPDDHLESRYGRRGVVGPAMKECSDCGSSVSLADGRPYKYEPSIWLCDDCHDQRMEYDG